MAKKPKISSTDLLNDIVDKDFDLSRFNKINEDSFEQAPNFVDFMLGRDFMDATLLPWQIEAGFHLFSDYCPNQGNGPGIGPCSNEEYLTGLFDEHITEIRDNVQFLNHGVCPKCNKHRGELFSLGEKDGRPSYKTEFVGNIGQRAGKSKLIVAGANYQMHQWLKLSDPLAHMELPRAELVVGTFSALSSDQAEDNLWLPFMGFYEYSPWFKRYNEFLVAEGKRLGFPLFHKRDTFLYYAHKRLLIEYTGSDDRKKRGRTRLFGAIDEIAYLNTEEAGTKAKKVMDADGNYAALTNSLETIKRKAIKKITVGFYNTPMSIMYNASSPKNALDKIMRLTKSGLTDPWVVVRHMATWEANPDYEQDSLRRSKSSLSNAEFMRDFGAVPPYSDSPFIGEFRAFEKLQDLNWNPLVNATPETYMDQMGDPYLYLKAKVLRIDKVTPRLLALDNGFTKNGFGACLFSYDTFQKKIILNQCFSLMPQEGLRIHFPQMFEEFILKLIQSLNIRHVFYDRWQSIDQITRLRDLKIDAQAHSVSFEKDMTPFRQSIYSGQVQIPKLEIEMELVKNSANPLETVRDKPVANLIWQALTVREINRKLLKPQVGDDDILRAFLLGGSRLLQEDIVRHYRGALSGRSNAGGRPGFAAVQTYSGGGGSGKPSTSVSYARMKIGSNK